MCGSGAEFATSQRLLSLAFVSLGGPKSRQNLCKLSQCVESPPSNVNVFLAAALVPAVNPSGEKDLKVNLRALNLPC